MKWIVRLLVGSVPFLMAAHYCVVVDKPWWIGPLALLVIVGAIAVGMGFKHCTEKIYETKHRVPPMR